MAKIVLCAAKMLTNDTSTKSIEEVAIGDFVKLAFTAGLLHSSWVPHQFTYFNG
jgi:hypothetical protein